MKQTLPNVAAVFGSSGGIGGAMCSALANADVGLIHAGSRRGTAPSHPAIRPFLFDLSDEASIVAAAQMMADQPPELVIVATGALSLPGGSGPERSYKAVEPEAMAQAFAINTIGPAMIARHILPLVPRRGRSVFAVISAKVGSISDNRIGGWHSYRASKAALNMLVRNWAIELSRTHPDAIVVSLHPGTVDTALSAPFQKNLPDGQLASPEASAANLLRAIGGLGPDHSGNMIGWDGSILPL